MPWGSSGHSSAHRSRWWARSLAWPRRVPEVQTRRQPGRPALNKYELSSFTPDDGPLLGDLCRVDWKNLRSPVIVHLHGRVLREESPERFPGLVATLDAIAGPAPDWGICLLRRALAEDLQVTGYIGRDTDICPALRT